MPTYEYGCDACGVTFEREQSIKDAPLKKCPECGKNKARRMIAGSGNFILKGSGWYSDLYSGPSNKGKDKPASGDTATAGEGKADSKTEGKTEGKGDKPKKPKKAGDSAAA